MGLAVRWVCRKWWHPRVVALLCATHGLTKHKKNMTVASLPLSKPSTKCIVVYFNPKLSKEGNSGQYSSSQAKMPQYKPLQLDRFASTHQSPTYLSSLPYNRQNRNERNRGRKEEKRAQDALIMVNKTTRAFWHLVTQRSSGWWDNHSQLIASDWNKLQCLEQLN